MVLAAFINFKLITQDGNEIYFKMRELTPLQKVMDAFCNRQGVSMNSVSFLLGGARINKTQTPKQVKMKDGDVIHVHALTH